MLFTILFFGILECFCCEIVTSCDIKQYSDKYCNVLYYNVPETSCGGKCNYISPGVSGICYSGGCSDLTLYNTEDCSGDIIFSGNLEGCVEIEGFFYTCTGEKIPHNSENYGKSEIGPGVIGIVSIFVCGVLCCPCISIIICMALPLFVLFLCVAVISSLLTFVVFVCATFLLLIVFIGVPSLFWILIATFIICFPILVILFLICGILGLLVLFVAFGGKVRYDKNGSLELEKKDNLTGNREKERLIKEDTGGLEITQQ